MTVNAVTGEIVSDFDAVEARAITTRIKEAAESIWSLLLEAHDRKAWNALGYRTWADYVGVEFDMARAHSYRLLTQARVIREIESVSPDGDIAPLISEPIARDLKPVLAEVKAEIKQAVKNIPADQPEAKQKAVKDVVTAKRAQVRAARPTPAPNPVATAVAAVKTSPHFLGSKAFAQLGVVRKLINEAGGVPAIVASLEGDMAELNADVWLGGIENMRDILDDWAQRLRRKTTALRRVK